jgi:hypothetical protein
MVIQVTDGCWRRAPFARSVTRARNGAGPARRGDPPPVETRRSRHPAYRICATGLRNFDGPRPVSVALRTFLPVGFNCRLQATSLGCGRIRIFTSAPDVSNRRSRPTPPSLLGALRAVEPRRRAFGIVRHHARHDRIGVLPPTRRFMRSAVRSSGRRRTFGGGTAEMAPGAAVGLPRGYLPTLPSSSGPRRMRPARSAPSGRSS